MARAFLARASCTYAPRCGHQCEAAPRPILPWKMLGPRRRPGARARGQARSRRPQRPVSPRRRRLRARSPRVGMRTSPALTLTSASSRPARRQNRRPRLGRAHKRPRTARRRVLRPARRTSLPRCGWPRHQPGVRPPLLQQPHRRPAAGSTRQVAAGVRRGPCAALPSHQHPRVTRRCLRPRSRPALRRATVPAQQWPPATRKRQCPAQRGGRGTSRRCVPALLQPARRRQRRQRLAPLARRRQRRAEARDCRCPNHHCRRQRWGLPMPSAQRRR